MIKYPKASQSISVVKFVCIRAHGIYLENSNWISSWYRGLINEHNLHKCAKFYLSSWGQFNETTFVQSPADIPGTYFTRTLIWWGHLMNDNIKLAMLFYVMLRCVVIQYMNTCKIFVVVSITFCWKCNVIFWLQLKLSDRLLHIVIS